jgi:transposase
LITEHTKKGSLYYSDDHTAYTTLNLIGKHQVVAHVSEEYVRDNSHINGIEGFWSYAKTWLYHYRGVPKQYFHLYLKEIEFRFNHRQENVFRVLTNIVAKTVPKVLPSRIVKQDLNGWLGVVHGPLEHVENSTISY